MMKEAFDSMQTIPMYKPLIGKEEIQAAREALEMGWLGMGSYVAKYEKAIKQFVQASDRYVAAVSTGTAALHLGLLVAGVGPGDEVITPSFNNVADFQAILTVGAEPVFCDIDGNTLCIDLSKAEELVAPRTRAIIVMDYGCMVCDHNHVAEFARKHEVRVIHDAAHSFGSKHKGKMIGSFSDICMFSFDPVKNITCIDGGALVVQTEEELKMVHEMRLIGMGQPAVVMYKNQRAWTYDVQRIGFRYHLANLHAAIGLAQLRKINVITESRRFAACYLSERLRQIPDLSVPKTDFIDITPFLYYVRVSETKREAFREHLRNHGIETGIHWQPGHWFTLFKNYRKGDLSVTDRVGREIVSLPLHSCMSAESLDRIVDSITSFFGR
jgi:dTDP-4-amino-4,6-dideoxygalactose transaminase